MTEKFSQIAAMTYGDELIEQLDISDASLSGRQFRSALWDFRCFALEASCQIFLLIYSKKW